MTPINTLSLLLLIAAAAVPGVESFSSPYRWRARPLVRVASGSAPINSNDLRLPLAAAAQGNPENEASPDPLLDEKTTKSVVSTVAVTGATGRTGQLVVKELLDRGVSTVLALVRDPVKAAQIFPQAHGPNENLQIVTCDLSSPNQIRKALASADAAIWCATGFSNNPDTNPLAKVKQLLNVVLAPQQTIDAIGLPAMAKALAENKQNLQQLQSSQTANGSAAAAASASSESPLGLSLPKVVMCSSAGVTRTEWDDAKKDQFVGAADIPIVRLNPFSILDVKRTSERELRQTCQAAKVSYCIVRPTGLNDKHPANSRPIFSQGDVAVGRIHRADVAKILVNVLTEPAASNKTFEVFTVAGYPPARSMNAALSRLALDDDPSDGQQQHLDDASVAATYHVLQQLLPGEEQDAAALAMGQTYEQLDRGEEGRLGERGKEAAELAAPRPSSSSS